MAEKLERVEMDSVVDLQVSVEDSLELGAAADELASDGDFHEASDLYDSADQNSPIGTYGTGGTIGVVAESPISTSATQRSSASEVREVSNPSERGRSDLNHIGQVELMQNPQEIAVRLLLMSEVISCNARGRWFQV